MKKKIISLFFIIFLVVGYCFYDNYVNYNEIVIPEKIFSADYLFPFPNRYTK